MSKQTLEMWYHPAKKEVMFKLFRGNAPIMIPSNSALGRYMNQEKGKFVLQNHGKAFFDDIAKVFSGFPDGTIRAITTRGDFMDFQQMVEHYNSSGQAKYQFKVLPGSVAANEETYLSDMNVICKEVRKHGEKAVNVLKKYDDVLVKFPPSHSEYAQKSLNDFRDSILKSIENITKNMERLQSNTVNLCFAGVYSAGKSALINSILGYRILPESVKSETAKMFEISSPRFDKGEKVSLLFTIGSKKAELQWDDANKEMKLAKGNDIKDNLVSDIKKKAKELKGRFKHEQIYALLEVLNNAPTVGSELHVRFPIPLDTPEVQFSIYDTPGVDSNFSAHEEILRGALSSQTSSILIFIALPQKLEGTGNRKLLSLVQSADTADHRSPIDLSRSLFVINAADAIRPRDRLKLQSSEIGDKEDSSFAIELADQKLFFTSARYAYAAKAFQNGILPSVKNDDEDDDTYYFKKAVESANEGDRGKYYKEDRCATSEYATSSLLRACDEALHKAQEAGDNAEIVHVCSGLYALEREILQYGNKYAAAVQAYAIINSVDSVLAELGLTANSLAIKNSEEVNRINNEIAQVRDKIANEIDKVVNAYRIGDNDKLPDELLKELQIGADYMQTRIQDIKNFIEKKFKKFLGYKPKDTDYVVIEEKLTNTMQVALSDYSQAAQKKLSDIRDEVIEQVRYCIYNNGNLTKEAQDFICDFVSKDCHIPTLPIDKIKATYDESVEKKLFGLKRVNAEALMYGVAEEALTCLSELNDNLRHQYQSNLEETLNLVQQRVMERLDQYSRLLKGMLEDKDSMERLGNQIRQIESELQACQNNLNMAIWKEEHDG